MKTPISQKSSSKESNITFGTDKNDYLSQPSVTTKMTGSISEYYKVSKTTISKQRYVAS